MERCARPEGLDVLLVPKRMMPSRKLLRHECPPSFARALSARNSAFEALRDTFVQPQRHREVDQAIVGEFMGNHHATLLFGPGLQGNLRHALRYMKARRWWHYVG